MKKVWIILFILSLSNVCHSQDGKAAFNFLKLPHSVHATALGGENISAIEDDLTLIFHNPALLCNVSDKTLSLGYTSYMEGCKVASAAFSRQFGQRSAWAVTAQYIDYGKMTETSMENIELGTFSAKDMLFSGVYNYNLSEYWSGGVTAKLIHSNYGEYTSFAMGVDLGINYFDNESDFSASLAILNLGGQIEPFDDNYEKLPANMQIGITKRLAHAPIRLSLTLNDLFHWESSYYNPTNKKISFGDLLLNHLVFGLEILPGKNFYIAAGYNSKRAYELKVDGGSKWTGMSLGAGLRLKRIKLGVAYAKYHIASSSLVMNAAITLPDRN